MKKQILYLQKLFYDIWNDFGSVYLVVSHSARTQVGKRGFSDEEKKQGLILVFNNKTNTQLNWDDEGNVTCVLAFGTRREEVFIHHDDLRAVFSPDAKVQFVRNDVEAEPAAESGPETAPAEEKKTEPADDKHVVSIDKFRKKKSDKH